MATDPDDPGYPIDYPQLPNDLREATVGQLVRYGFGGPFVIDSLNFDKDEVIIRNPDTDETFVMVKTNGY